MTSFQKLFKQTFTARYNILLLVIWQFFSVLIIALGIWPSWVIWINLGLTSLFILLTESYVGLLLCVVSMPFYTALPNAQFETLSAWRVLFALLTLKWFVQDVWRKHDWKVVSAWKSLTWMPWDRFFAYFALLAFAVTVLFGKFRVQGFKQIIFWLNAYLLYIVAVNVLKNKEQVKETLKFGVWSLAIIITLGYAQLFYTFFTTLDVFWVYWARNISALYYGKAFSEVALYSNSWFSFTGGRELRMFSVMPDSQSFGHMAVIGAFWGSAFIVGLVGKFRRVLWSGIRFASLAVILSGTRAVWVGLLAPLGVSIILLLKKFNRTLMRQTWWVIALVIVLFAISPLINSGLRFIRVSKFQENFLDRAGSILNLQEQSNLGRLIIWEDSLRFAATRPWGVGVKNFVVLLSDSDDYATASETKHERYNLPNKYVTGHNLYLQLLVETGVAGVALFAVAWYTYFKDSWKYLKKHMQDTTFETYLVFQMAAMFLWILAAAFFDITFFNDRVLMFVFLSLALSGVTMSRSIKY